MDLSDEYIERARNDPRTTDDLEIRDEALVGLALRGDIRVVPSFLKELAPWSPEMSEERSLIADAASAVVNAAKKKPDKKWCSLLEKLRTLKMADPIEIQSTIEVCKSVRL